MVDERTIPPNDPIRRKSRDGLLEEIARLRSRSGSKLVNELRQQVEREQAKREAAVAELGDVKAATRSAGIEGEEVAGHPAVASYRKTWRGFTTALQNLPGERQHGDLPQVQLVGSKVLTPDLQLFELTTPRSTTEAITRHWVRRCLTLPSRLDLLSRETPAGRYFLNLLNSVGSRTYFRPSVWYVFTRTAEDRDKWSGQHHRR